MLLKSRICVEHIIKKLKHSQCKQNNVLFKHITNHPHVNLAKQIQS